MYSFRTENVLRHNNNINSYRIVTAIYSEWKRIHKFCSDRFFFYLCVCKLCIFSNDIRFITNSVGLNPLRNFYPIRGSSNVQCQNIILLNLYVYFVAKYH